MTVCRWLSSVGFLRLLCLFVLLCLCLCLFSCLKGVILSVCLCLGSDGSCVFCVFVHLSVFLSCMSLYVSSCIFVALVYAECVYVVRVDICMFVPLHVRDGVWW
jgi:hypothetical protein